MDLEDVAGCPAASARIIRFLTPPEAEQLYMRNNGTLIELDLFVATPTSSESENMEECHFVDIDHF